MNNLQLATTLVAPTGTGLLYTAYSQGGDKVVWKNGSGQTRKIVTLERVQPKPTAVFPGVERLSLKSHQYYAKADGTEGVVVVECSASVPVDAASGDRIASALAVALLARDPVFQDGVLTGVIPT